MILEVCWLTPAAASQLRNQMSCVPPGKVIAKVTSLPAFNLAFTTEATLFVCLNPTFPQKFFDSVMIRYDSALVWVFKRQALTLLSANLVAACDNGNNLEARQAMLVGAMLAGQAFANAPCAAVHALAYPIGGIFHVPHGLSNSLVLPHVLRFNLPDAAALYAELADIVAPRVQGSVEARAHGLIAAMEHIAQKVGIETRLQQVGITASDLDRLADDAMLQTRLLTNNPREMSRADARAIYQAAP